MVLRLDEPPRPHRGHPRPRRRPPLALRAVVGLGGVAMVLFNVALLLSDRAPGVLRRVFGDLARRLSDRIDAGGRAGLPSGAGVPPSDLLVHVGLWGLATVLVGLAVWTWRGLAVGAVVVFAGSVVTEVAQGAFSTTRTVERADAVGNAAGVLLGVVAVGACYLLWSAVAGRSRTRAG